MHDHYYPLFEIAHTNNRKISIQLSKTRLISKHPQKSFNRILRKFANLFYRSSHFSMLRHLSIRPARFSDGDFVKLQIKKLSILAEGFKKIPDIKGIDETWKKIIDDPSKSKVFIAEEKGKPVGAAVCSFTYQLHRGGEVLYIQELSVDESARELGVGKALLNEIEDYSKKNGIVAIDLTQPPPGSGYDEIRNKFYQKNGYNLTGMGRTKEFVHNFILHE